MSLPQPATDGRKLTDMQQAFVENLLSNGGDKVQAAIDAGYSPNTADIQVHELLRKPHVMNAIIEGSMQQLAVSAPLATRRLIALTEARSEYVALQAAQDILNRLGIKAPDRVDHRVTGDIQVHIDLS